MTIAYQTIGKILHLQRLSTEDGPGLRTTIFYKGCPLSCAWCHNPESIRCENQIQWMENRCIGCNTCIKICPKGSLARNTDGIQIDGKTCTLCGECIDACPGNSLEILGKQISISELVFEVAKDKAYFDQSKGGVTLSGGEPTLQPSFTLGLLQEFKVAGISTALDTCGLCSRDTLSSILPYTDTVLFDLKIMDEDQHLKWTGQSNRIILDNLVWLVDEIRKMPHPVELWVRTPLIPGATDSSENISAIGNFLGNHAGDNIARWELCAFNNLCQDKYRRLGMDWLFEDTSLMKKKDLDRIGNVASQNGFPPEKVFITGASKVEDEK